MKIAVLNFSGNVGKSTVSRHLLADRLKAEVISVESINYDGEDDSEALKGKEFQKLMDAINVADNVVVDIGASNVEEFIARMKAYKGSHEDFDLWVVPTVPKAKQLRDTISTIIVLSEIGIPADQIRIVFNMLEPGETLEDSFASVLEFAQESGKCVASPEAVVHANELFGKIKSSGDSIPAILADQTDYKAEIKAATDPMLKVQLSQALGLKRLAAGVKEELDRVFNVVVGA